MNALELLMLGRTLMKLAGSAMPVLGDDDSLPASVRSVLMDVSSHPDSSVGAIAERTGFPQSHVSASIARLQERGMVATAPDPRDRRRTLVRAQTLLVVHASPADDVLLGALADPEALPEVKAALETLRRHLLA
ncbi:MarR family transcriptional regulator [Dactylosporangium sp. CS-033363]|uniref:MarR family transcriptional regulator n=1 Tax=Dactylosporangium sp. CS-033363 TaxID=3239935 RepID=UPI003D91497D